MLQRGAGLQDDLSCHNKDLTKSGVQGLAYPYHWGALRPAQSAAFLALQYSQLIRTSNPTLSAKLFNYAEFQACLSPHSALH